MKGVLCSDCGLNSQRGQEAPSIFMLELQNQSTILLQRLAVQRPAGVQTQGYSTSTIQVRGARWQRARDAFSDDEHTTAQTKPSLADTRNAAHPPLLVPGLGLMRASPRWSQLWTIWWSRSGGARGSHVRTCSEPSTQHNPGVRVAGRCTALAVVVLLVVVIVFQKSPILVLIVIIVIGNQIGKLALAGSV